MLQLFVAVGVINVVVVSVVLVLFPIDDVTVEVVIDVEAADVLVVVVVLLVGRRASAEMGP